MSGIGSINVPQVQTPNYSGLGSLIAQGGVDYGQAAQGFLGGLQAGNQQQQLAMQKKEQEARMPGLLMQQEQQKQQFMSDMAYGISKLPEDKQEAAYKQVVGGLLQQGILQQPPPEYGKGGKDMVQQLAAASPRYAEEQKSQIEGLKTQADIGLKTAQADYYKAKGEVERNPKLAAANKPLSAEAAKIVGLAENGIKGIEEMKNLLSAASAGELASGAYLPTAVQGQKAQDYDRLRTSISETLGRMNSGGAINKDEEARFLKMMPKWSDTEETKQKKLDSLYTQINTVRDKILPMAEPPEADKGYVEAAKSFPGLTQEQYKAALEYDSKNK